MGKKYYITLAVLTTFLLLATIGSVAQQQDYIAIKIKIVSDNSVIIAKESKNVDIPIITRIDIIKGNQPDSAEGQDVDFDPDDDDDTIDGNPPDSAEAQDADIELIESSDGANSFQLDSAEKADVILISNNNGDDDQPPCGGRYCTLYCPCGAVEGSCGCRCKACSVNDISDQSINQFFTILIIGLNLAGLR